MQRKFLKKKYFHLKRYRKSSKYQNTGTKSNELKLLLKKTNLKYYKAKSCYGKVLDISKSKATCTKPLENIRQTNFPSESGYDYTEDCEINLSNLGKKPKEHHLEDKIKKISSTLVLKKGKSIPMLNDEQVKNDKSFKSNKSKSKLLFGLNFNDFNSYELQLFCYF